MLLTLVGASLILRRIKRSEDEEEETNSKFTQVIRLSVMTSAPGIILAVIGTVLMFAALSGNHVDVRKQSIYTREWSVQATKDTSP
jgi:putative Mn2+ efflux pump MntP